MSTTAEIPGLRADDGFQAGEEPNPIRFSGFVCLLLGLLSGFSLLGQPLLVLPVAALALGLIALRPAGSRRPLGRTPAKVGIVLAVAFGSCGFFLPFFKAQTLGAQAEHFGRQYMELLSDGEVEYAMELRKDPRNRNPPTTPLKDLYGTSENAVGALEQFRRNTAVSILEEVEGDPEWVLVRPPRVFRTYDRDRVEMVWKDASGIVSKKFLLTMGYVISEETGDGQWRVLSLDLIKDWEKPIELTPV